MDDLLDEDVQKEFATEWEQELLDRLDKTGNDLRYETTDKSADEKNVPNREHLDILVNCFGHKQFRPLQWKIISSIINERRDNCAIMTTGYGKSLCYQYPSTYVGGITLVISPLISLMEDQVLALEVANIPACLLGTANTQQKKTITEIFENKYTLVYLTPEFCTGEYGLEILQRMYKELSITLIAVDEAHCVSSWGHDFRFQYRVLGKLKELMPDIPVLAVTATATPKVRDDIIKTLKLKDPQISCSGFDRPNLYFKVYMKGGNILDDLQKAMKLRGQVHKFSGSTIIYCLSRKLTEDICSILKACEIKCLPYHAGLSLAARKTAHEQFLKDKIDVIVATIAFGMGIDKPDIRNIIHYGSPNSLEGYYQEVGRSGRDGLPAVCTTFYANSDFDIHRRMREGYSGVGNKANKEKMADLMMEYLTTRNCRRQFILSYFEQNPNINAPKQEVCCDNCTRSKTYSDHETYEGVREDGKYDFTQDAKIFLSAVNAMGGKFGMNMYVLFIKGSKSNKMTYYVNDELHGSGKDKSENWWKGIGALLLKEKYLKREFTKNQTFSYSTFSLSAAGCKFLKDVKNGTKLITTPTPDLFSCLKNKKTAWLEAGTSSTGSVLQSVTSFPSSSRENQTISDPKELTMKLYKLLLNKRYELATSQDCMPYLIASNKALMDMAAKKPSTLEQMRNHQYEGFTEAKILKFGEELLNIIRPTPRLDNKNQSQEKRSIQDILTQHPLGKVGMAAHGSYSMFKTGLSTKEIASRRNLTENTVIIHLIDAMKLGYTIKMKDLGVTSEMKKAVIDAVKTVDTGITLLTPIKNACPEDMTFIQVKAVVTYLQIRSHLKNLKIPYEEFEDNSDDEKADGNDKPNTKEEESAQLEPLGNLTQFLNFAKENLPEYNKEISKSLSKKESYACEDSNFSDGIADEDLAAFCDELETSLSQDLDSKDVESSEEPLAKRSKTDDACYYVLDSPPRQKSNFQFKNETDVEERKNDSKQFNTASSSKSNHQPSTSGSNTKKKLNLPPWLVSKRIA